MHRGRVDLCSTVCKGGVFVARPFGMFDQPCHARQCGVLAHPRDTQGERAGEIDLACRYVTACMDLNREAFACQE